MVDPTPINEFVRAVQEADRQQAEAQRGLRGGGRGGTSGGMEEWKISVDRQLGQLHGDIRMLLGGIVLLLTAIGGLYLFTNAQTAELGDQIADLRVAQAKMQGDIEARDTRINGKVDVLLERMK